MKMSPWIEKRPGVWINVYCDKYYFFCMDCLIEDMTMFMVYNSIWKGEARMKNGNICISCFEDRLGRDIAAEDLTDAPINTMNIYG